MSKSLLFFLLSAAKAKQYRNTCGHPGEFPIKSVGTCEPSLTAIPRYTATRRTPSRRRPFLTAAKCSYDLFAKVGVVHRPVAVLAATPHVTIVNFPRRQVIKLRPAPLILPDHIAHRKQALFSRLKSKLSAVLAPLAGRTAKLDGFMPD